MIRPSTRTLMLGIWLGLGSWALAQSTAPASPAIPPLPSPSEAVAPSKKRFDLDLKNNTAKDVIDLISHQLGYPLNIVFVGNSAEKVMPSLRLHQVTLEEFFAAMEMAGNFGGAAHTFSFVQVEKAPNVYVCNVQDLYVEPETPPTENAFFDLQPLLTSDQMTVDDITTAISTAWMADGAPEPKAESLRFHQETKLLIVTAPPSRLQSATALIKLLTDRTRPSTDQQQRTILKLEDQLDRANQAAQEDGAHLRAKLEKQEVEMAKLREQIAKLEIDLAKREVQR